VAGREELRVIVYDDELVDAIGKITDARRLSPALSKAKGEAVILKEVAESRTIKEFIANIPRIGRAQRLLLTQVPLAREALAGTYRAKMLAGTDPVLAIAVISVYVVQQIKQMWETIKQERISYENMLQEGLDVTYSELKALTDLQTGYATWWNQFQSAVETDGFKNAVRDTVMGVLPALLQGEYVGAASGYQGAPHNRWKLFDDLAEWLFGGGTVPGGDMIPGQSVPVE